MKYGTLKQTNPEYDPALWRKLDDLYVGGFQILKRVRDYIPKLLGENDERYNERLQLASYINYLGMVVDSYVGNLFAQEPVMSPAVEEGKDPPPVDDYWAEMGANANLKGESFAKLLRCTFLTAILDGRAVVACDFPASDIYPETRAEEDSLGTARAYAFESPLEELLDWEYSEIVTRRAKLASGAEVEFSAGRMKWAILRRRINTRERPEDDRGTFVDEYRVWTIGADGLAQWQLFRTPPRKPTDAEPKDDDDIPMIGEGTTTFREIPLVELRIPPGLWLGNRLGPLALHGFRQRSSWDASANRSLFPQPVVKLGPEIGGVGEALPSEVQQNPNRGSDPQRDFREKGVLVLGKDDEYGFAEPQGTALELVDKKIAADVDEFFRVANMMAASVSSTKTAVGRSGSSKEQDYRAMTIVLEAYAAVVKDFAVRIYDVVAEARGEVVEWTVSGLDKFDVVDRAAVLEEAKAISAVPIASKTFKAAWQFRSAMALLGNLSPDQQKQIRKEIVGGITAEEEASAAMRDAFVNGSDDELDQLDEDVERGSADARASSGRAGGRPAPQSGAQVRRGSPPG